MRNRSRTTNASRSSLVYVVEYYEANEVNYLCDVFSNEAAAMAYALVELNKQLADGYSELEIYPADSNHLAHEMNGYLVSKRLIRSK
jgi:hypothetical protein